MNIEPKTLWLLGGTFGLLALASGIVRVLEAGARTEPRQRLIRNVKDRTTAWWWMAGIFSVALATGPLGMTLLFALLSFLALREFITLTPTKRGDHRALFWAFFIILPIHYWALMAKWKGLFFVVIPVYAFLFIPMRMAMAGQIERFLERTAKIQWGLMVCVFCLSHAPALLILKIPNFSANGRLLFFLVFVTQISDVLQFVWGKTCGKRPVAPAVSPNKTVEGLIGGGISATLFGTLLWWATPFTPVQAAVMSMIIVIMGFAGGLVMSAIKRDRGVKDWGDLISGHGGVMDRLDSLCFAAPVFFHVTHYFFT